MCSCQSWIVLTEHLVICNGAIAVNVIQLESPSELLIQTASRSDTQRADKLLKVDRAVLVLVKYVKDKLGKGGWVAKGEELLVDTAELLLVERARGAVLEESLVPGFEKEQIQSRPARWGWIELQRTTAGAPCGRLWGGEGVRIGVLVLQSGEESSRLTVSAPLEINELLRGKLGLVLSHCGGVSSLGGCVCVC